MNKSPILAPTTQPTVVREYVVNGTKYIVKSVFIGTQDIQSALLRLAERKTLAEMGLDSFVA